MKKHLAVIGAVTAISAAGLTGVGIAHATNTTTSTTNPMSSLVDAIASKFNLDKSKVQSVFDEQRTKMDAERETQVASEVAQLVKDGKLTQTQADSLNAKRAELTKEREANRTTDEGLTEDQRRANMDKRRTALDTWLKAQGIDQQYAHLLMGGRGHGPGGPGGDRGQQADAQNSTTSTTQSQ